MKIKFSQILMILLIGAASAAASYCAPMFMIVVTAAIGCIGTAWGVGFGIAALAASIGAVAAFLPSDPLFFGSMAGMVALGSAMLMFGLRKKLPYRTIAIVLAIIALIGVYVQTCLPSMLAGKTPYAGMVELMHEFEQYYSEFGMPDMGFDVIAAEVPAAFYGYLIFVAEGLAFLTLIICKKFCTLGKCDVRGMDKFMNWQIPFSLKFGLPILAAGCLILYLAGYRGAETLMYTLIGLLVPLLWIEGFTSMLFIIGHNRNKPRMTLLYILLAALVIFSPYTPALMGVVELYLGFRRKVRRYNAKMRAAFEKAERDGSSTVVVDFDDGRGPQIIAVRKRKEDGIFFDDDRIDDSASDPFGERTHSENKPADSSEKPDGKEDKPDSSSEEPDGKKDGDPNRDRRD